MPSAEQVAMLAEMVSDATGFVLNILSIVIMVIWVSDVRGRWKRSHHVAPGWDWGDSRSGLGS